HVTGVQTCALPISEPEEGEPLGYGRVFGRFHRPLATKDGFICVIANTDLQWERLFVVLGTPELLKDPRFSDISSRMANIDALYEAVEAALRARPSSDCLAFLARADIPSGPSYGLDALRPDPHLEDRGFFVEREHQSEGPLLMTRPPIEMSGSPASLRLDPP